MPGGGPFVKAVKPEDDGARELAASWPAPLAPEKRRAHILRSRA
jgi:hypothetical protein